MAQVWSPPCAWSRLPRAPTGSPRDDLMREKIAMQQERTGEQRGGAGLRV